jgi:hypothetical protein
MTKILKNLLVLTGILVMVIYFSSCEQYTYLVESELPPVDTTGNDSTKFVSFSNSIQPIFTDKCIGCHKPPKIPDLREGYSHASLTTNGLVELPAETSVLYKTITELSSHKSMCTKAEKDSVYVWISQGALDN